VLRSAAIATDTHEALVRHLRRPDGQEDLCFALYRTSTGASRETALISDLVLPADGERHVHGNVAFTGDYFLRAAGRAADADAGLALLHSHPGGVGWQDMSPDDVAAEQGHAAQTQILTDKPLLGLTLATGDEAWSARSWTRDGETCQRRDCRTVRVAGDALRVTHHPRGVPLPRIGDELVRTVSVWGPEAHAALARLHIGIVGLGSVGSMVAEALARTGIGRLTLIDFDSVKPHNLDRIMHATARDVAAARSKVNMLERALRRSATNPDLRITALELSVTEPAGWAAALDCDVLFSCVDRPWPRHVLNLAAYAHLIPVIDGGILAQTDTQGRMLGADWKAHVAAPGRRCLQCARQYDPAAVTLEREGLLDDPTYINGLPNDHPLRARQNVFAFSMSTASLEVLQLISMVVAPQGIADLGGQNYHAVTGTMDIDALDCAGNCAYRHQLVAGGDTSPVLLGAHTAAGLERATRGARGNSLGVRLARRQADLAVWIATRPRARERSSRRPGVPRWEC